MPKNIGAYQQGKPIPHAEDQPHEAGVPQRAKPAGVAPGDSRPKREAHKMNPNNDAHIAK
jgi:hypothetical protein